MDKAQSPHMKFYTVFSHIKCETLAHGSNCIEINYIKSTQDVAQNKGLQTSQRSLKKVREQKEYDTIYKKQS